MAAAHDDRGGFASAEPGELDAVQPRVARDRAERSGQPRVAPGVSEPCREKGQDGDGCIAMGEMAQEGERFGVRPMDVIQYEQEGPPVRRLFESGRELGSNLGARRRVADQRSHGRDGSLNRNGFEGFDDRAVRPGGIVLGCAGEDRRSPGVEHGREDRGEPALADSGFADRKDEPDTASLHAGPRRVEARQRVGPTDERPAPRAESSLLGNARTFGSAATRCPVGTPDATRRDAARPRVAAEGARPSSRRSRSASRS